jgi:hypothetical protein
LIFKHEAGEGIEEDTVTVVLKEVQPRVYALTGGFFANWMPPDKVDVGDYGVIAKERAAEFLARSEAAGNQRSAMDENVRTASIGQGRAMRSAG